MPSADGNLNRDTEFYATGYKPVFKRNIIYLYTRNKNMSAILVRIPKFYTTHLMRDHYADLFARALKNFINQIYKNIQTAVTEETTAVYSNRTNMTEPAVTNVMPNSSSILSVPSKYLIVAVAVCVYDTHFTLY